MSSFYFSNTHNIWWRTCKGFRSQTSPAAFRSAAGHLSCQSRLQHRCMCPRVCLQVKTACQLLTISTDVHLWVKTTSISCRPRLHKIRTCPCPYSVRQLSNIINHCLQEASKRLCERVKPPQDISRSCLNWSPGLVLALQIWFLHSHTYSNMWDFRPRQRISPIQASGPRSGAGNRGAVPGPTYRALAPAVHSLPRLNLHIFQFPAARIRRCAFNARGCQKEQLQGC